MGKIDYREDNKWTVYIHIVPKELSGYEWDKYYVGITTNIKRRWRSNGIDYKPKKNNSSCFYNAIQKYGWNNMKHEIISERLTKNEAENMEQILIKKLKSNYHNFGYNRTKGGEGGNRSGGVNIAQYDLQGNFLNIFDSIEHACVGLKCSSYNIIHAIKKENSQSGGYMWRRVIDGKYPSKIPPYSVKRYKTKSVIQYDDNWNFIRKFNSIKEASEILNVPASNISNICNKNNNLKAGGFHWSFAKDPNSNLYYWVNNEGIWESEWDTEHPDLNKYKLSE